VARIRHAWTAGPPAGIEAAVAIQNPQSRALILPDAGLVERNSGSNHSHAAAAHFRKTLQPAEVKSERVSGLIASQFAKGRVH
jgi:hypothetical protein